MKHDYGGAFERHPIAAGTAVFADGSRLKAHDIMDPLPAWMAEADMIFTDSPWNTGNLRSFYTKAEIAPAYDIRFEAFQARLIECVAEIAPRVCWLEIGKEYLAETIVSLKRIFPRVTFFESTYYHQFDNHCYCVRAALKPTRLRLDGIDEEDIIARVCREEDAACVGDLCMGRGLVALAAYRAGRRFVGTELNHKRLSVALERLAKEGAQYRIEE